MKRAMLVVMLDNAVLTILASGASAAESVGHLAAAERDERTGEPVRVHDHADGRQRDDPHARSAIPSR